MEPPIRDPLRSGQPLYKGHLLRHHANTLVYSFTSEIGTTSLQGTKLLPPKCPLFGGSTVIPVLELRNKGDHEYFRRLHPQHFSYIVCLMLPEHVEFQSFSQFLSTLSLFFRAIQVELEMRNKREVKFRTKSKFKNITHLVR